MTAENYKNMKNQFDYPKIPDINLFRGKRSNRQNQYQLIQKQGLDLLARSKNKQLVQDLKTKMYLDSYRSNLNHFISPVKYKDKAEKYLKTVKSQQNIHLKTMRFPMVKMACPQCFSSLLNQKRCYCQTEGLRINANFMKERIQLYEDYKNTKNEKKLKNQMIINGYISIKQNQIKKSEAEPKFSIILPEKSKYQILLDNNSTLIFPSQNNKQKYQQTIHYEHNQTIFYEKIIRKSDNGSFIRRIQNKYDYLQGIDLNIKESRNIQVDFDELIEAKKQYVSKNKEIIDKLQEIICKNSEEYTKN